MYRIYAFLVVVAAVVEAIMPAKSMNMDICKPLTLNQVCPIFMEHQMIMCFVLCEQYSPTICCCIFYGPIFAIRIFVQRFDSNVGGFRVLFHLTQVMISDPLWNGQAMIVCYNFIEIRSNSIWYDNIYINHNDIV